MRTIKSLLASAAAMALLAVATPAHAVGDYTISYDISGWQTWGGFNGSNNAPNLNSRVNLNIGALHGGVGVIVTGVGWDVNYESLGESWTSEMRLRFQSGTLNPPGTPGAFNLSFGGTNAPGTNASSSAIIKLAGAGLPDLTLPDGILHMQAFESFNDGGDGVQDAQFGPNSIITIQYNLVPAPGALALLGLAGVAGGARRRRA